MLLREFIDSALAGLQDLYPRAEARSLVNILVEERLGVSPWAVVAHPEMQVGESVLPSLQEDVRRLCTGEPLQYVLGFAEFYGRRFRVTENVLIPRPETELLVEAALSRIAPGSAVRILDLCTGSGCIAWTLALERPGASVTAVDISPGALSIARSQFAAGADSLKCNPICFLEADVLGDLSELGGGKFDIIVSNPPYVMEREKSEMRSNVLDHEPALALFVPDDDPLVFYRAIARHSSVLLADHGWGLVEINALLADSTAACFRAAGFPAVSILPDLSGHPRFVFFGRE